MGQDQESGLGVSHVPGYIVSKSVGVKSGRVNGIWFYGFKVSECC